MSTFERIYEVVKQIPQGKVATYGQVALLAGNPRWSRVVGYALHVNPDPSEIPCHRVVNRFGEVSKAFAFGGENVQIHLLESEGVIFIDGRVNLSKHLWDGTRLLQTESE
ncbi:MAG: MGMT family protein [Clostridiales bacterium]|jgi:methylated-DNA-protein-cysteine methyltransferase-like protein|nr:MGMT family protein [Clostridiales bacterium]